MDIRWIFPLLLVLTFNSIEVLAAEPNAKQSKANTSIKIPGVKPNSVKSSKIKDSTAKKKRSPEVVKLVKEAEELKKDLIQLNRDLYHFEEELLYPTETQLAVFLSLNAKSTFTLDSIELLLDDKLVGTYLYQDTELEALKKGGIQRIYLGSLSDGRHKLTAQFNGQGANNSYFRRKKALKFTKENSAKFIQMEVSENSSTREPLFKVKQW